MTNPVRPGPIQPQQIQIAGHSLTPPATKGRTFSLVSSHSLGGRVRALVSGFFGTGQRANQNPAVPDPTNVAMTNQLHGQIGDRRDLLAESFAHLLNVELRGDGLNGEKIGAMSESIVASVRERYDELSAALTARERMAIEAMIPDSNASIEQITTEYIANALMFRAIRDFYELAKAHHIPMGSKSGFILLTVNGSIVSSPPIANPDHTRHISYTRIPSRTIELQTGQHNGRLKKDIEEGHKFHSEGLHTSAISLIIEIPEGRQDLFELVDKSSTTSLASVSMFTRSGQG